MKKMITLLGALLFLGSFSAQAANAFVCYLNANGGNTFLLKASHAGGYSMNYTVDEVNAELPFENIAELLGKDLKASFEAGYGTTELTKFERSGGNAPAITLFAHGRHPFKPEVIWNFDIDDGQNDVRLKGSCVRQ